jgi:hypothetical protein
MDIKPPDPTWAIGQLSREVSLIQGVALRWSTSGDVRFDHQNLRPYRTAENTSSAALRFVSVISISWRSRCELTSDWSALLRQASLHVPENEVLDRLRRTERFDDRTSTAFAAAVLGLGSDLSCVDTVTFALWIAATGLDNFADAMWREWGGSSNEKRGVNEASNKSTRFSNGMGR